MKKPPQRELSSAQTAANKHLSGIRTAIERTIAAATTLEFYRLNWSSVSDVFDLATPREDPR